MNPDTERLNWLESLLKSKIAIVQLDVLGLRDGTSAWDLFYEEVKVINNAIKEGKSIRDAIDLASS